VMDKPDCPLTLGKTFLATAKALINLEYEEIMLMSKGKYLIHHISQDNIRTYAGTECHAAEDANPYNSHEEIEIPRADQEKYGAANIRRDDVREGATKGSWKKTPYGNFKVRDHVFLRHPEEFHGYLGNLQASKGWVSTNFTQY